MLCAALSPTHLAARSGAADRRQPSAFGAVLRTLVPGQRTVTSILRIGGLCRERRFVNYHRVLNRAAWSGRAAARVLLGLLLGAFVPKGPVLLGLDDHIERRRGKRISAKGIYRDPVRSSKGHFVKASGLRWLSLMLLVPISWAGRVWALPFLTVLAPSERHSRERGRRRKTLTDWARQLVLQARRWMPERALVLVADSSFAALELLASLARQGVTCVTRLRLDAALYTPAPPRRPRTPGRPRTKGERLPTLGKVLADRTTAWQRLTVPDWCGEGERVVEICSETAVWRHSGLPVVPIRRVLPRDPSRRFDPQALLCTDLAQEPLQIVRWFVQRWQLEATFREVRDHLGVEPRGPRPLGRRDPAAVVRPSHRPHHALPARPVLRRDPARHPPQPPRPTPRLGRRLVSQAAAHLR